MPFPQLPAGPVNAIAHEAGDRFCGEIHNVLTVSRRSLHSIEDELLILLDFFELSSRLLELAPYHY